MLYHQNLLTPFKALINDRMVMISNDNNEQPDMRTAEEHTEFSIVAGTFWDERFEAIRRGRGHNFFWIFLNCHFPCSMVITYQNRNRRDWQEELEEPM